ncbi:hypothetical protein [Komagataeibacter phage phiKX1]|nr:hypothetical protein [Komagataeibacter phage phiKX1]BCZ76112.1 hypothetical protein [Komagataeibacter phage phiKX2]
MVEGEALGMSRTNNWMPLYIADYLADTGRLNTLQHGAYLLILMEIWRNGPIRLDHSELSTVAKMDKKTWEKSVWPSLERFFVVDADGAITQKRLTKERAKAEDISNKRRAAVQQRRDRSGNKEDTKEPTNVDKKHHTKDHTRALSRDNPQSSSLRSEDTLTTFGTPAAPSSPDEDPPAPTSVAPKAKPPTPLDQRSVLFGIGSQIVCSLTGKPPRATKSLIGKWLRDVRDDCAVLNGIIQEAADTRPADPVSWITGAVKARSGSKLDAMARDWRLDEIDLDAAAEEDCRRQGI